MRFEIFEILLDWLLKNTNLESSRWIDATEKLTMFLIYVGQGISYRMIAEIFGHSLDTVSRVIKKILYSLIVLHKSTVKMSTSHTSLSLRIEGSFKYYSFFKDCIGALDRSHIPASISVSKQAAWRNRKDLISQNVLAVCDMDMYFTYILAEWESTAHDGRVLNDVIDKGFTASSGKYYLADAGYSNTSLTLVSYRGVRYHLKEQAQQAAKSRTKEELFNLRHFSLRNVIERLFGVMKRRFRVLRSPSSQSIRTQVGLIYALTGLNNFIHRHNNGIADDIDSEVMTEQASMNDEVEESEEDTECVEKGSKYMNVRRDDIC